MPAIVGPLQIVSIGTNGVTHFGDTAVISPKGSFKYFTGSGTINTGALFMVNNAFSITATFDANLIDQPIFGNN
ncbi:spore germination protein [Heyndrickxia sporothermodurans]